jgi:hypothetical protein
MSLHVMTVLTLALAGGLITTGVIILLMVLVFWRWNSKNT